MYSSFAEVHGLTRVHSNRQHLMCELAVVRFQNDGPGRACTCVLDQLACGNMKRNSTLFLIFSKVTSNVAISITSVQRRFSDYSMNVLCILGSNCVQENGP